MKQGFALLLSLIITSVLLVVGLGVSGVAFREMQLSVFGNQSEISFYAAETGLGCAFYWDKVEPRPNPTTFATSTFVNPSFPGGMKSFGSVNCSGASHNFIFSSADTVKFNINNPCVNVEVKKNFYGNPQDDKNALTTITSMGYNTCDASNPRRVARVLKLGINP